MKFLTTTFAILLAFSFIGSRALAEIRIPIAELQKVLDDEQQNRAKLTDDLDSALKEMQGHALTNDDRYEIALQQSESKIADRKNQLTENHLRIEFLNTFISALDRAADPKKDAPDILRDLAQKQILASVESNQETRLWAFEIYLSIALKELFEPGEKFGEFIKKYMEYSTIRDPRSPQGFLKKRNYLGDTIDPDQKLLDQKVN